MVMEFWKPTKFWRLLIFFIINFLHKISYKLHRWNRQDVELIVVKQKNISWHIFYRTVLMDQRNGIFKIDENYLLLSKYHRSYILGVVARSWIDFYKTQINIFKNKKSKGFQNFEIRHLEISRFSPSHNSVSTGLR